MFLLMHCVLLLRLWWGDSDLLVAWYLVSCPTSSPPPFPPSKPPPSPHCPYLSHLFELCPAPLPPPPTVGLLLASDLFQLQSSLSILYNTVLYCMSLQTCHVGLSWFDLMFCCYYDDCNTRIMSLVLMHRMAFLQNVIGLNLMLVKIMS